MAKGVDDDTDAGRGPVGITEIAGGASAATAAVADAPKLETPLTDRQALEAIGKERFAELMSESWREPLPVDIQMSELTAAELDVHIVTALRLEKQRFFSPDFTEHDAFLRPTRDLVRSPEETVEGMDAAAQHLVDAIARGEKVAVFADYDVDGTTSAAVFQTAMQQVGADEDQQLWEYAGTGFGLTEEFVENAHGEGASTLVTLDCGSTQSDAIARAKELGMTVIVVDHHNVDLDNPADFHLNPKVPLEARYAEAEQLVGEAKQVFKDMMDARDAWLKDKTDPEVEAHAHEMAARAHEMMGRLDAASGAEQPSSKLKVAIERLENAMPSMVHADKNTGAQLTWKIGAAMHQAHSGEVPDQWYGRPMYMAGQGALGDMTSFLDYENRVFVRVPVDEADDISEVVPPAFAIVAEHFGEDPANPGSCIRAKATFNQPKRTVEVPAALVHDAWMADTREKAEPLAKHLIAQKERSDSVRDEMMAKAEAQQAKRAKRIAAEKAEKAADDDAEPATPKWVFVKLDGYSKDAGQGGQVAQKMAKANRIPAAVAVQTDDTDAHGNKLSRFSSRNDQTATSIGVLIKDPKMRELFEIEVHGEDGEVRKEIRMGGHDDVVSGTIRTDRLEALEQYLEAFGDRCEGQGAWARRASNKVYLTKRMVSPGDLEAVEREARLFWPIVGKNYPPKVSVAGRCRKIGKQDPDSKAYPATLELADGSTRDALVPESTLDVVKTGGFFEVALNVDGSKSRPYWLSRVRPITRGELDRVRKLPGC